MSSALDLHIATLARDSNLAYLVAVAAILVAAWLLRHREGPLADVPLYKVARTKWFFSADSLIRDSYNKVRLCCPENYSCGTGNSTCARY